LELDERKSKILNTIIRNYLETGEPVGSRTISKYSDLSLSSATIRNEMADLEELEFIMQPHTSAGRIPSDKGYRWYVNQLIENNEKEKEAVSSTNEFLIQKVDSMEIMLKNLAKILAVNTNYPAMVTGPTVNKNKLKFIQLSKVDLYKLLIIVIVEGNVMRNTWIDTDSEITDEVILNLNILLNNNLVGLTVEDINLALIRDIKNQAGKFENIVIKVLDEVEKAIGSDDTMEVYTSGATNIFKYPELRDEKNASELIDAMEEKQVLAGLIASSANTDEKNAIQVYIGQEAAVKTMKDCSIVTATYELGEGMQGTIGIIGPKRMDYDKVVGTLRKVMSQLDAAFNNK